MSSIADRDRDLLVAKAKALVPVTRQTKVAPAAGDESPAAQKEHRAQVNIIGSRIRQGSTISFGKYPLEGDLKTFLDWLQTVDGKERSASQAKQIAVDVSKYLFFAEPTHLDLTMAFNVGKGNEFNEALKKAGLRAAGILSKILCIRTFLSFMETVIQDDGQALTQPMPADALAKIGRMRQKLTAWHSHFSKLKEQVSMHLKVKDC